MIVTLTPNPSLDRTVEIDELRRGEVHRATGGRVDPGGKGVNVSRALAACDTATIAVLPSGGPEGAQLAALLAPFGVQTVQVPIGGTVRSNITVAEPDGTTTKLNEAGPELTRGRGRGRRAHGRRPGTARELGGRRRKPAARARCRLLRPARHGPAGLPTPRCASTRAGPRSPRRWTRART